MTSLFYFLYTTLENTASLYMYSSLLEAQTLAANPKLKHKLTFPFCSKVMYNSARAEGYSQNLPLNVAQ